MEFIKQSKEKPWMLVRHAFAAPFIYSMIAPLILLDISVEIYHRVTFPLYGIPYVERSKYIRIDRHKLSYLNWLEKIDCSYCGYANGLIHYISVIVSETERYWCGIQHERVDGFRAPHYEDDFLPYGDEEAFKNFLEK